MGTFNYIPLKDLNQISSINDSDYLLVINENGLNLLPKKNVLLENTNVSWYTSFVTISNISSFIKTSSNTQFISLSSDITIQTNNTVNTLSALIDSQYDRIYYAAGALTIPAGATRSNVVRITTNSISLCVQDLMLCFKTEPSLVSRQVVTFAQLSSAGGFNRDISAYISNTLTSPVTINYRIFKPY